MKSKYLNDQYGMPIFRIEIKDKSGSHCEFNIYEIIAWEEDKTPLTEEMYLSCTIYFDHHSHFYFGELDKDGNHDSYLHLCGPNSMVNHVKLMLFIYDYADEVMEVKEPYYPLKVKLINQ